MSINELINLDEELSLVNNENKNSTADVTEEDYEDDLKNLEKVSKKNDKEISKNKIIELVEMTSEMGNKELAQKYEVSLKRYILNYVFADYFEYQSQSLDCKLSKCVLNEFKDIIKNNQCKYKMKYNIFALKCIKDNVFDIFVQLLLAIDKYNFNLEKFVLDFFGKLKNEEYSFAETFEELKEEILKRYQKLEKNQIIEKLLSYSDKNNMPLENPWIYHTTPTYTKQKDKNNDKSQFLKLEKKIVPIKALEEIHLQISKKVGPIEKYFNITKCERYQQKDDIQNCEIINSNIHKTNENSSTDLIGKLTYFSNDLVNTGLTTENSFESNDDSNYSEASNNKKQKERSDSFCNESTDLDDNVDGEENGYTNLSFEYFYSEENNLDQNKEQIKIPENVHRYDYSLKNENSQENRNYNDLNLKEEGNSSNNLACCISKADIQTVERNYDIDFRKFADLFNTKSSQEFTSKSPNENLYLKKMRKLESNLQNKEFSNNMNLYRSFRKSKS